MAILDHYRWAITLSRADGSTVAERRISMDWDPALESTRFEALRRGRQSESLSRDPRIEPVWSTSGPPSVDGFRLHLADGAAVFSLDFPRRYFAAEAKTLGAKCVSEGSLGADEAIGFTVTAFAVAPEIPSPGPNALEIEEVIGSPPIQSAERAGYRRATSGTRLGAFDAADMPVIVPERIVDEVRDQALRSRGSETGGFLLGHLRRCEDGEIFLQATAQLEAGHTLSELTKLTFTAQTWADLRDRMRLRRRAELLIGWWHSHPVRDWNCKNCPTERQRVCPLAGDFFSDHDRALHRTVFPMAYAVALVANDVSFSPLTFSMFGWRRGLLESRGFYVSEGSGELSSPAPASTDGGLDGN